MTHTLEPEYDSWHRTMRSRGLSENPLEFPWYETAFGDMHEHARGDVLEVGCGRGEFAIWLTGRLKDSNITAIDFSHDAIAIAKEFSAERKAPVCFRQDNAQALGFHDNSFDYVVSCECMEHVPDPARMAREIYRVLKPNGRFCLTTENYLNGMLLLWAKSWITGQPFDSGSGVQPRENFFFFWHVLRHLRTAGLIVEKTQSNHYQWLMLPRTDPAKLCTKNFSREWARRLAKPFGRHFSFFGRKPAV